MRACRPAPDAFVVLCGVLITAAACRATRGAAAGETLDRTGTQWAPVIEWSLKNATFQGNPFDLEATATFIHAESGEKRTTGMFYAGEDTWAFRFTGTRPGKWTFTTTGADPDLNGRSGVVTIKANPGVYGFVTHVGSRWARQGGEKGAPEAFVPQFVMYDNPNAYYRKPEKVEADIRRFMVEHGFTGFHTIVCCRWFDIDQERSTGIKARDPNPDPRTFEALELLITKVHAAGGVVHIWAWGDESRRQTPMRLGGKNGPADRRLQRTIAARLGPLPGWTMGYGYDLDEWTTQKDLQLWHSHMRRHMGWPHMLGGRSVGPNRYRPGVTFPQIDEGLDYWGYEQHRPTYEAYVAAIEARPQRPAFSEDRFRIRQPSPYPEKDYTEEMTRRGLWHSTMAGGVANIWGNLAGGRTPGGGSNPYPHPEWIKTYSAFFRKRFHNDMVRDNAITDGVCLMRPGNAQYLFYREEAASIQMDLSGLPGRQRAVAVDAKRPYAAIDLGSLEPREQTWTAPHTSDWAIAVGDFGRPDR